MSVRTIKSGRLVSLPPCKTGVFYTICLFFPAKSGKADEAETEKKHRQGLRGHD